MKRRFPDSIKVVGWAVAFVGAAQAAYSLILEYTAENLAGGKLKGHLAADRTLLLLQLAIGVVLLAAGLALVAKQLWAWWIAIAFSPLAILASVMELVTGVAVSLDKGTSFPQVAVAIAGAVVWTILLAMALQAHPVAVQPEAVHDAKVVDEHTLAVVEATRRMSSRKREDWGGEGDEEELVESLIWMAQARGGRDFHSGTTKEQEARDAEIEKRIEELPSVIDASPLAIAVGNAKGKVTLWNPAAERLFGWSAQEMMGQPVPLGTSGIDAATLLDRTRREGSVIGIESRHPRKAGAPVPISMSLSVLPDTSGAVGGYVVALADITKRHDALAQQLERRRSQAMETTEKEVMARFSVAGEWVDESHSGHAHRVAALVTLLAMELGYSKEGAVQIARAALLHDVGKVGVSAEIWNKKGRLTDEEFDSVKSHTQVGADILTSTNSPLLKMAADIAYSHHERWDGQGYLGLKGEEIPIGGRMVAVADAFDALTHDRPYRKARTIEQAVEEIEKESGNQFDPSVVGAFLKIQESGGIDAVNAESPDLSPPGRE